MKLINTKNGILKVNHKLVALLLAGTTLALTGCVPKNNKQEVETNSTTITQDFNTTISNKDSLKNLSPEIKVKDLHPLFQVERTELEVTTSRITEATFNTLPEKRKKDLKEQSGNNKVVIHTSIISPTVEIPSVKLKIKDSKGNLIDYMTTTSNGIILDNLIQNEQYIIEVDNVDFYSLELNKVYTFTLKDNNVGDCNEIITNHIDIYLNWKDESFKIENPEIRSNWINISTIDLYNNEYVTGGRYAILDEDNKIIMAWSATDEPCRVSNLKDGNYTIIERESAEDYTTFVKKASITIKGNKVYSSVANEEIESKEIIFYAKSLNKIMDNNNQKKLLKTRSN